MVITDELRLRLKAYGEGNLSARLGTLFEMLDEIGYFNEAAKLIERQRAEETAARIKRFNEQRAAQRALLLKLLDDPK